VGTRAENAGDVQDDEQDNENDRGGDAEHPTPAWWAGRRSNFTAVATITASERHSVYIKSECLAP
jgi:hypothetical protein